jgi:hypothetical protein
VAVIVLLADGARPDILAGALDTGALPALARLRDEGGLYPATTCFPSVTGPAYAPFLMGRFPGSVGLPGLRWFDRDRTTCSFPDYTRSYVGYQMRDLDGDLSTEAPTIFERAGSSIGALNVIGRGLPVSNRVGALTFRSAVRAARTHFRGDPAAWLDVDREISRQVIDRIARERPEYVFAALTGVDKASHAQGHDSALVLEALRIVDDTAAELRALFERRGTWESTHLWVSSDHGHSPVLHHENLAGLVASYGHRVVAHPWIFKTRPDVAVMVSGNAMAHLYLELGRRERPFWRALRERWEPLAASLLERPSVDLLMLPLSPQRIEVRARDRGTAVIEVSHGRFSYFQNCGDPLGIGDDLLDLGTDEAYDATIDTDYPDSVVQIGRLALASRSGEIILSAARNWDFRDRYEPIPHVSSHGALHREHMMVPLLLNQPAAVVPRRTTDTMASALAALDLAEPVELDGASFIAPATRQAPARR